jgi:hypothetical protein
LWVAAFFLIACAGFAWTAYVLATSSVAG